MQVDVPHTAGSELHRWRSFLARATVALALLLLASAAICAVAANWAALTKLQRLAGVQAAVVASAVLATWLVRRGATAAGSVHARACVVGLATVLLGALLALVGQAYQTGADSWELFAMWALLSLPWAVAARSQGVWLFWIVIANLAVASILGERALSWWIVFGGPGIPGLVLSAFNLGMLAVWELVLQRRQAYASGGRRLLVLMAVGVLVLALMFGQSVVDGLGAYTGIAWVAVTLALGWFYMQVRRDLAVLALLAAGIVCVSLRVVGEWLWLVEPGIWMALPLAALLMGESVVAARWLRRLAAQRRTPALAADIEPSAASAGVNVEPAGSTPEPVPQSSPLQQATPAGHRPGAPWYVQGLLALSAWLATLLVLAFLFMSGVVQTAAGALIIGLALCAVGVAIARAARQPFWRQCATALGFAGQILVATGLSQSNSVTGSALLMLALSAMVYALAPDAILRFLSGLVMAMALFVLTAFTAGRQAIYTQVLDSMTFDAVRTLAIWLPAAVCAAWLAVGAFLLRERMPLRRRDVLQPLAWAFALAGQAAALLAAGVPVWEVPALWALHPPAAVFLLLAVLLPVLVAVTLMLAKPAELPVRIRGGLPCGLLVLAVFWLPAPGIALALAWLLLGVGLQRVRLLRYGQAALLLYLVLYYYQLDVPLLQKAVWLGGAAVLLLLMRAVLGVGASCAAQGKGSPVTVGRARHAHGGDAVRQPWRASLVLAGLLLALVVVNTGIWRRERLLATGQVVRLALAPADPRALMQGDYMELRFAAVRDIAHLQVERDAPLGPGGVPSTDGYLVLQANAQGIAQPVRVQAKPQPRGEQEVVLRYRLRPGGVRLVTNAFFFPEGEAQHYGEARYGELRVGEDGTALLVGLLGADLQPL